MTAELNIFVATIYTFILLTDTVSITEPSCTKACVGQDFILDWSFPNETELNSATWLNGTTIIATKTGADNAEVPNASKNKVEHLSNGIIRLRNVQKTDAGSYKLSVTYTPSSQLLRIDSTVNIRVEEKPNYPCRGGIQISDKGTVFLLLLLSLVFRPAIY